MKFIEGIVITQIDDKKVAICTGDAVDVFKGFINLNDTAYEIWMCLEKNMSIEEIANQLVNSYDELSYEDALNNVVEFIEELKNKGILVD